MDHTDVKMVEIGVHKMLETLVSKIVERSMTYKQKEVPMGVNIAPGKSLTIPLFTFAIYLKKSL